MTQNMILTLSPGSDQADKGVPLVIIPCGARKADRPTAAGDLYIGPYHRSCRQAADALTVRDWILILFGKHGLLRLDEVIAPYDLRMGAQGSVSPGRLREQAEHLGVDQEPVVIVLAGRDYAAAARSV